MRRRIGWMLVSATVVAGVIALGAGDAQGAGIITHAWMGTDAIEHVADADLRALLTAHVDQVRAGAQFPDGGYATRALGTPGGDYGEEAHWQRFVDAYTAQIRNDPACGDLTDPDGPCAPVIAHLMGVAAHGMGDEVWDWLFEPNAPAFGESYLPADFTPFVGPGGIELQMDLVAVMRHGRPTGPTPPIPDATKIKAAFDAVGRADISADAFPVGENFLGIERNAEAFWAPRHIDTLERAMPWSASHMTSAAGGVDFGARAVAGYYESIWADLQGAPIRTRVAAAAPSPGRQNVPATGWTANASPGSNPGNSSGLTRIAVALSSALPHNALADQGPVPSTLPADALRLRDTVTGALVPARSGYPRIVPYNPEAGEHMAAFQPAADLQPCRWYRVEVTRALVDARRRPVEPTSWRFRTSGCTQGRPVRGTVTCDAAGAYATGPGANPVGAIVTLSNCSGGQDGNAKKDAGLPIVRGLAGLVVQPASVSCRELTQPTTTPTISGGIVWYDAQSREIGRSFIDPQAVDPRGGLAIVRTDSRVFGDHAIALRVAPEPSACDTNPTPALLRFTNGRVTAWTR
jgi:hypothetical protein